MGWRENRYNRKSAKKLGWHPSWFASHLRDFDDELTHQVKIFQFSNNLECDGLVGPMTFRRIMTNRELTEDRYENYILINGKKVAIEWDAKVDLIKPGAFRKVKILN